MESSGRTKDQRSAAGQSQATDLLLRGLAGDQLSLGLGRPQPARQGDGNLLAVLRDRFGFDAFRPHQEEVCRAVTEGRDSLLVMPTGSGKSLCYQLPGIARGGTTLVISPLIALMEDQTAKLQAMGLRAERIHSGHSREASRAACRAWLDGELDFLTIAPERLSVPGFPEMLARRKPTLIAVDEAHCISHWGHDFRPDYRLLRQRLPLLRPAPVLALTATATVRVQGDILEQLGIPQAQRFIRGFRRENLALEAVERPKGERTQDVVEFLAPAERRPGLVYVPTRRAAEELAEVLAKRFKAAAYHAGLSADERARTQESFLAGELEVVVATVAFGMGVDKPDVRSVVHTALPGSLEGYYQEIGRAGRDGKLARALLLYSWGDRKLHETFLERDYPETQVLEALRSAVPPQGVPREGLMGAAGIDLEVAEAALDKLWIHGGVSIDAEDVVRPAKADWRPSYESIRSHRQAQLDEVLEFARGSSCRMVHLLRHFGETRDRANCGRCDACRPEESQGRSFRAPTAREQATAERVIELLEEKDGQATGTLYRTLFPSESEDRSAFERILQALVRVGALRLYEDGFEKDGRNIRFKRAGLMPRARKVLEQGQLQVEGEAPARPSAVAPKVRRRSEAPSKAFSAPGAAADPELAQKLREWRLQQARARGVPAFRILTDRTLFEIAERRPQSIPELMQISGVGPKLVEKYGAQILKLLAG